MANDQLPLLQEEPTSSRLEQVPIGTVTAAEIETAMTPPGGFTRAVLAKWGVPWPPPKSWRRRITKHEH